MIEKRVTGSRTTAWWAAACFVLFALFNSCSGHRAAQQMGDVLGAGQWKPSVGIAVGALRALGTDDGDINRYFAYANAVLGRPYQGYYVRPLEGWKVDARTLVTGKDVNDPAETPPVVPAAPLVPYRDFLVEYPPGFFLFAVLPALAARDTDTYRVLFSSLMALLLALGAWACARMARHLGLDEERLAKSAAITALLLGTILVRRYDAVVSLSLCVGLWGCLARRPVATGVALAVGIAAKALPLLLCPLPILYYATGRRWREATIAVAAALACGLAIDLPFAQAAGAHLFDMIAYHGERPLQIESTAGALLVAARLFDPGFAASAHTFGSANVVSRADGPLRAIAGVLPMLALAAIFIWTWLELRVAGDERTRDKLLLRATCASLVALMALGKVFSPQYLTWLVPLALLLSLEGGASRSLLLVSLGLTQLIYPLCYRIGLSESLSPWFGLLVLARNALLVTWAARLLVAAPASAAAATVAPAAAAIE